MGEIAAAFLAGVVVALGVLCVMLADIGVWRWPVVRLLCERRRLSRDQCDAVFADYYERQRELAKVLPGQLEALKTLHSDHEIVLGVHRWELPLVMDMAQVQGGKFYGKFEIRVWSAQTCQIATHTDRRFLSGITRPGNGHYTS